MPASPRLTFRQILLMPVLWRSSRGNTSRRSSISWRIFSSPCRPREGNLIPNSNRKHWTSLYNHSKFRDNRHTAARGSLNSSFRQFLLFFVRQISFVIHFSLSFLSVITSCYSLVVSIRCPAMRRRFVFECKFTVDERWERSTIVTWDEIWRTLSLRYFIKFHRPVPCS